MLRKPGLALVWVFLLAAGVAAQLSGRMQGEVRDKDGKPFPDVTVVVKSDEYGTTHEVKTDSKGQFTQSGLRPGMYTLTLKNAKGQTLYEGEKVRVTASGNDPRVEINLKEIMAQQGAAREEAEKKQQEEQSKFESMKAHFDAGTAALNEARQVRDQVQRAPRDQRAPFEGKLGQLQQTAISEYEAAQKNAPQDDPNLHKVLASLGQAYDLSDRYAEAAASYEKAVALKPNEVPYYLLLGTALAHTGKLAEAGAACEKVVALDKATAATCWRNVGIVLYNSNKLKEAVEPFRRASQLDPNYADTWYLLGASLLAAMDYKQEGDKLVPVVLPGTAEAYQKYLELAPNGRFANETKAGLSALESLGAGIETKVKTKKK